VAFDVPTVTLGAASPFMFALSPDGRYLVGRANEGSSTTTKLLLRAVGDTTAAFLPGTDAGLHPFWSADSRRIGFFQGDRVMSVDLNGSPAGQVATLRNPEVFSPTAAQLWAGGSWNASGDVLLGLIAGPVMRVRESGGELTPATTLAAGQQAHRFPRFLPDGRRFLYRAVAADPALAGIFVGSLEGGSPKRLLPESTKPEFSPPNTVLFVRNQTLLAQDIDLDRLELVGEPRPVAKDIGGTPTQAGPVGISASNNGVLAFRRGGDGAAQQLTWYERSGRVVGTVGPPGLYENPRLSPDGTRLAFARSGDIWVTDLLRSATTRITFDGATDNVPLWSPDGSAIMFVSNRGGVFDIYRTAANGSGEAELVFKSDRDKLLNDWSADGRFVLYQESHPQNGWDLWSLSMSAGEGGSLRTRSAAAPPRPVKHFGSRFDEFAASFSPDGRWLAYASNDAGVAHVFVQAFPPTDTKWQVSAASGTLPRWSLDGTELFYDGGGPLMAATISAARDGTITSGVPRPLFVGLMALPPHNLDVARDGRFLVITTPNAAEGLAPITVVVNWRSP
jgi:Tol biopolymer transport system component